MRKFRQHGVVSHAVASDTIRRRLRSPKDKVSLTDLCGAIYYLECTDCGADYVGETERPLHKRLSEHQRDSSPVGRHLAYNKHHLSEEKILDRDSRWFQRGVREAIHIRSRSPTLNDNPGRHYLPQIYNQLLARDSQGASGHPWLRVNKPPDSSLQ